MNHVLSLRLAIAQLLNRQTHDFLRDLLFRVLHLFETRFRGDMLPDSAVFDLISYVDWNFLVVRLLCNTRQRDFHHVPAGHGDMQMSLCLNRSQMSAGCFLLISFIVFLKTTVGLLIQAQA